MVQPDRLIVPGAVILHPDARSTFVPGTDPSGNSQVFVDSDLALLVIDDSGKFAKLNTTWSLPHGQLVNLPQAGFFDALSPTQFRQLPLIDVGYGRDWINTQQPFGPGEHRRPGRKRRRIPQCWAHDPALDTEKREEPGSLLRARTPPDAPLKVPALIERIWRSDGSGRVAIRGEGGFLPLQAQPTLSSNRY